MGLSKKQIEAVDGVIRNLNLAIKNCSLYAADHPICHMSLDNLKAALDKWFLEKDSINLGISQDNIFLDGIVIKEEDDRYKETADFLHARGVIAVTFTNGINTEELTVFFNFIKQDKRVIRSQGGVLKNLPPSPHIKIKEIDYRALLVKRKETREEGETEEDQIWQFLFDMDKFKEGGTLPKSKVDFLVDFFSDTKKSSKVLNKIYKEAVESMEDEEAAGKIKEAIKGICVYFEEHSPDESKDIRTKMMTVISQLHPDLVTTLFEQTVGGEQDYDLAEAITEDFSDAYIAEFIESLISDEDTFNENLLKVFDKLAPEAAKADNIVSMVADKLFNKRVLNPEMLTKMQMSIKEIFKSHSSSNFMSQLYKITVDSVINKKIDTLVYVARLSPEINKFVQAIKHEKLKKEEIWLLLNILWLENSPEEFKKFGEKLIGSLPELLDTKDVVRIKEIMEFFTDKMRPEQISNPNMVKEQEEIIDKIASRETKDSLISFIPDASSKELDDIGDILTRSKKESAALLIDAFIQEKNPAHKNKYKHVFSFIEKEIIDDIVDRLEYCQPSAIRPLFEILREHDEKKAHLVAIKLISSKDSQVRWQGLEGFIPETDEEINKVFIMYKREKDREVMKKIAAVLLKIGKEDLIGNLFHLTEHNFSKKKFLLNLIELCGLLKAQQSFNELKRIALRKRRFFYTRNIDDIRIAAMTSLGRLDTTESLEVVKAGLEDKHENVRKMCEIIIKLTEGEQEEQLNDGENNGTG